MEQNNKMKNNVVFFSEDAEKLIKMHKILLKEGYRDDIEWNKMSNPTKTSKYIGVNYIFINQDNSIGYYNHSCNSEVINIDKLGIEKSLVEIGIIYEEGFVLPEKWCIQRNAENSEIVNEYFNKIKERDVYYTSEKGFLYNHIINDRKAHEYSPIDGFTIGKHEDFTELTFDQFKKYVLKENTQEMNKEIEGFRLLKLYPGCPNIKVGEIQYGPQDYTFNRNEWKEFWEPVYKEQYKVGDWVITKGYTSEYDGKALRILRIKDNNYCFFNKVNNHNFSIRNIVRKATLEEIAATQETILTLGTSSIKITIGKDKILADGKKWDFINLRELFYKMGEKESGSLNNYKISFPIVKIGCSEFNYIDIKNIIDKYNEING